MGARRLGRVAGVEGHGPQSHRGTEDAQRRELGLGCWAGTEGCGGRSIGWIPVAALCMGSVNESVGSACWDGCAVRRTMAVEREVGRVWCRSVSAAPAGAD